MREVCCWTSLLKSPRLSLLSDSPCYHARTTLAVLDGYDAEGTAGFSDNGLVAEKGAVLVELNTRV